MSIIVQNELDFKIPKYRHRKDFIPRNEKDYGDGGAYPEIHIPQFPLGIGKKPTSKPGTSLALQVNKEGNIQYDQIAKQSHSKNRVVQSNFKDLLPINYRDDKDDLNENPNRPTEEEALEKAKETKEKLDLIVSGKMDASRPKTSQMSQKQREATYIRYTSGQKENSESSQRILKVIDLPVDPMEPARFKHKKIPRGPPSPPAPVLHSPPRKITAEEQKQWVIPPCISNWKNAKGYTIPLDKRLAADGRGLQEHGINDKFANFSEALFTAERLAREEIKKRASYQHKLYEKEKLQKEENLRQLAKQAREANNQDKFKPKRSKYDSSSEDEEERKRSLFRKEKAKERERQSRSNRMGTEQKMKYLNKNSERDISEKVALGLTKASYSKDSGLDSRLFNQNEGVNSGFKDDDQYDLYDKPLFKGSSANLIYKYKKGDENNTFDDEEADEFLKDSRFDLKVKSFKGSESNKNDDNEPVQFENEDPFGLDQFLAEAKSGKKD